MAEGVHLEHLRHVLERHAVSQDERNVWPMVPGAPQKRHAAGALHEKHLRRVARAKRLEDVAGRQRTRALVDGT